MTLSSARRLRAAVMMGIAAVGVVGAAAAARDEPGAQSPADGSVAVYDQSFFSRYPATTAEDLLRRIPGVSPILDAETGELGERGFGSSGAQILIDGARVAAKANDVLGELRRIRAESVERVELIRGGSVDLDVQSEGVVVNIVLKPEAQAGSGGTWEANARVTENRWLGLDGQLTYDTRLWGADVALGVEHQVWTPSILASGFWSDRTRAEVYRRPDGSVSELRPQDWRRDYEGLNATANVTYPMAGGAELKLNGLYRAFEVDEDAEIDFMRVAPDGSADGGGVERQTRVIDTDAYGEIGGQYERPLAGGMASVVFVVSREDAPAENGRFIDEDGATRELSRIARDRSLAEDILRGSFTRPIGAGHTLEIGGEVVDNRIDQDLDVAFDLDGDGVAEDIPIPTGHSEVQEDRWEGYVEDVWRPGAWAVESSLTYESSEVSNNFTPARAYEFWKPRVDARRTFADGGVARFKIERTASQLDFNNFVPIYDVLDDEIDFGNLNLAPETTWLYEAGYERRLAQDRGSINVRVFYADISDAIDKIQIGVDGDGDPISAFGNLPSAERYGFEAQGSLRLTMLRLPEAVVTGRYLEQEAETTDPFTGETRGLRNTWDHELDLGFRHELPAWSASYGANYVERGGELIFSDVFVSELYSVRPTVEAFAEIAVTNRMTLRVEGHGLTNSKEYRDRTIFATSQTDGAVARLESFEEVRDRRFVVKLRGTF